MSTAENLKNIVEAALLAAGTPLTLDLLQGLFTEELKPDKRALREALEQLAADYEGRGIAVVEVSSGWRVQVRAKYAPWVSRLWEEKPARYSRALMETLALVAYRQPITRGEIEEIRGVSVSTNIMRTLQERGWVTAVGQRDVPGRPSLYATTRTFLDYFGLKSLDALPTLAEIRDLEEINQELNLPEPNAVKEEIDESEDGGAHPAAAIPLGDDTEAQMQSSESGGDPASAIAPEAGTDDELVNASGPEAEVVEVEDNVTGESESTEAPESRETPAGADA